MNAEEDWTVDVSGVVKRFKLRPSAGSLKTAAIDFLARRKAREFTALDGVTLRVRRGETVGIVGENGAGKSTLLSIVAGTMRPTAGTVRTRGTVSSLLELGAGFHPDLTGRENVMLYGAIMGIPRSTMRRRFDEIVEFSGLEKFIDQPVRFYSSGMYVRLGFSVAVQVDPDILLVDEVLAVGDADFQRKCLAKMDDFRRAGKSMVLISHDIATVRRVSDRIAYLSHGKLIGIGDPAEMSRAYAADTARAAAAARRREWGNGEAEIVRVRFLAPDGSPVPGDAWESPDGKVRLRIDWKASRRLENPVAGFSVEEASSGRIVHGSNTQIAGYPLEALEGEGSLVLWADLSTVRGGDYLLSFSLHDSTHSVNWHRLERCLALKLPKTREFDGVCCVPSGWSAGA
ncbi:MAG: ABC transporter ATP-binding protein [Kiritimatiellae bacterium]|nr:ABC transporter ATP-binding protein [Kiritimatiellia bacterium]